MATLEQPPVQRIPHSRSTRLADQGERLLNSICFCLSPYPKATFELTGLPLAATAALYVTHPERRLSAREPSTIETDLSSENNIQTLETTEYFMLMR
jgi:hypothetical protein